MTDPAGVERFLRDAVASGAIDRGSFDRLLARLHPSAEVVACTTFPAAPVALTVEAEPAFGTSAPEPAAEQTGAAHRSDIDPAADGSTTSQRPR